MILNRSNILFLFICLFGTRISWAQKKVEKIYDAQQLHTLAIESDDIFKINVRTAKTTTIRVITLIEGETFENTVLRTQTDRQTLRITTGKTPDYIPFNDKLSTHKVLSIVLEITLPEGMHLYIDSVLAEVNVQGTVASFTANMGRGVCTLDEIRFRESITVNTLSGAIYVKTTPAQVDAQSRNGLVVIPQEMNSTKTITLRSIYGDIVVENWL